MTHPTDQDQSWSSFFLDLLIMIVIVVGIRVYIFQFFRVSGPSMCPTLNVLDGRCLYPPDDDGEFIFLNQFHYNFLQNPERGEIVVFKPSNQDNYLIKRILGVPGDELEIRNGQLYLTNNDHTDLQLTEPYLNATNRGRTGRTDRRGTLTQFQVPDGHYLLIGDNRADSMDSRHCFRIATCKGDEAELAYVPIENIKGRAEFVAWPPTSWRSLEHLPLGASSNDEPTTPAPSPRPSSAS